MAIEKTITRYFREEYRYSFDEFQGILGFDIEKTKNVLKRLKSSQILKVYDERDTIEFEELNGKEVITDSISDKYFYKFEYVGIVYSENVVFRVYPKYIDLEDNTFDDKTKDGFFADHFKTVMNVLQKYNKSKSDYINLYNGISDNILYNRIEIELYLLSDYYQNGLYSNEKEISETNGEGEIDWDRTINETMAVIKNGRPYYVELQTKRTQEDENDYFKMLHECVLSMCSRHLDKAGTDILSLLDITPVDFSDAFLSDFGDAEYIVYRLNQEIRNQFITRKQNLLKTLVAYISEEYASLEQSDMAFFGTNQFHRVWEAACAEVFNDVKEKYSDLIEKAKWYFNNQKYIEPSKTLELDTISEYEGGFYILDAKYYLISHTDSKVQGQPGIQDIVKQFAYHKAFYNFLQTSDFSKVANAFLVPQVSSLWTKTELVNKIGEVRYNIMQEQNFDHLTPIQVRGLNPCEVYKCYLSSELKMEWLNEIEPSVIVKNNRNTAIGYIHPDYFDQIKKSPMKSFLFYSYCRKGNDIYEMDPELPNCRRFIGFTNELREDGTLENRCIKGEIVGAVQVVSNITLDAQLKNRNIKHKSTAETYYCLNITDIEFCEKTEFKLYFDRREQKVETWIHKDSPCAII